MKETTKSAPFAFRFDFPPDVAAERTQVLATIRRQMVEGTHASVASAVAAQTAWLERFPDDYGMWDLGESLWMLSDALEAAEPETSTWTSAPSLVAR